MKKFLPVLVLSALFAALLVPATASVVLAAACPANCLTIPAASDNCVCGPTTVLPANGSQVCGVQGTAIRSFNSVNECLAARTAGTGVTGAPAPNVLPGGAPDLINLIEKIGGWVFIALMSVAGTFLVIAGFLWVTAGGDPEKAKKAKQMLINSLIGVVIGLLARGVVEVIRSIIGG